jgi:hypothetical protein
MLVRVERHYLADGDGSVWELVIGPAYWESETEKYTDIVGDPVEKLLDGGIQKMTHWMPWPEDLNV